MKSTDYVTNVKIKHKNVNFMISSSILQTNNEHTHRISWVLLWRHKTYLISFLFAQKAFVSETIQKI